MKTMTLGLAAAAVLGGLTFGLGAASAAPASPAGIQAGQGMVEPAAMDHHERRMMRRHMMRRHMMKRHMMHRRMHSRGMHRM
ncbi:hypothetical protein OPKNFCMD_1727 [Methylobacterium crusticola]|uniref:Pentapeptide MXKDX repeat protein n=1 Tax=Methylobacterium crusticola TaxID=1697972 RepID=A0ABQ4QVE3_9HYPH|nr:hypothetical protein [Methylobacterium crusticola]GJD49001.1 hypothetical protein OPKNFCMD_1727 [Methylobacterium crusticola]